MKTTDEYMQAAINAITEYPAAALAYQVQDPRTMALLRAMATQLSMRSQEQDVAALEAFMPARDMTVYAAAAAKGVMPFGTSAQMTLKVQNVSGAPFSVLNARVLLDQQGRRYVTTQGATVAAGATASITVAQRTESSFTHIVSEFKGFYRIPIPAPDDGLYMTEIRVVHSNGTIFTYTPEFTNIDAGDTVFHLESDEYRQVAVVLGAPNIGGYVPSIGEKFTVTVALTEGEVILAADAPFVFEHATTVAESGAKVSLSSVQSTGANPLGVDELRELIAYPAMYDGNAVFQANFAFLLRRNLAPFRFLSVWNEQTEEEVRGANVKNMNTLFVAAQKDGVATATLQEQIARVILGADNSYKVRHVAVKVVEIPASITLTVPDVYSADEVKKQATEIVLAEYGPESKWSKKGLGQVLNRRLVTKLQAGIVALQADDADIVAVINEQGTTLPESYRYISAASLTVNVLPIKTRGQ